MTHPHEPQRAATGKDMFWWPRGRSRRAEYWIYVALQTVLSMLLSKAAPIVGIVMFAVYLLVQVRRLHDFGRSAWWVVGVTLAGFAVMIPLVVLGELNLALGAAVVLTVVPTIWIGVVRGDAGDNRFGPPPPFTARRVLTGR